jgi:hypothetical protein
MFPLDTHNLRDMSDTIHLHCKTNPHRWKWENHMGSDNLQNKNDNPHHYYTDHPHTTCSTHTYLYRDRYTAKGIHMQCHPSKHPQALQYNHWVECRDTYRHPGSSQEGMYILHLTIHHSYRNNPVDLPHSSHIHPYYSLRDT